MSIPSYDICSKIGNLNALSFDEKYFIQNVVAPSQNPITIEKLNKKLNSKFNQRNRKGLYKVLFKR